MSSYVQEDEAIDQVSMPSKPSLADKLHQKAGESDRRQAKGIQSDTYLTGPDRSGEVGGLCFFYGSLVYSSGARCMRTLRSGVRRVRAAAGFQ